MEIEVGEYVRTKNGKIYTVKSTTKFPDGDIHIYINEDVIFFRVTEIVKHSFNIIDLIEIKDIVEIQNVSDKLCFKVEIFDEKTLMDLKLGLEDNEIKLLSIVTKEQMKSVEYKIEEVNK